MMMRDAMFLGLVWRLTVMSRSKLGCIQRQTFWLCGKKEVTKVRMLKTDSQRHALSSEYTPFEVFCEHGVR